MSVEITITSSRALACSGRLVAGETADITVTGGAAASLYLVDNKREVIAVCTTFEQGAGSINLATVPIGDMVFGIPAGRLVTVMALIKDAAGSIIGYGSLPLVSAPMPANLEDIDVDLFIKASDIRALFANLPTVYPSQRTISDTLAQVVTLLKNFGLCLLFAFAAHATEWQDVPGDTVIGEGLTLTNGEIRAAGGGGGGLSTNDVRAIIEADVGPTNRLLHADSNGELKMSNGNTAFPVILSGLADGQSTGGLKWDAREFEGYFVPEAGMFWAWCMKNKKFILPMKKGGTPAHPAEVAITDEITAATNGMATAEEVAQLRTDASLVYQLLMGSNVVAEVTNYNSRVHAPSFRLLQLDPDTHEYITVWTETNGLARTLAAANEYTDAASAELAGRKADRAWGKYTSGLGAEAPSNTTWVSSPVTVIAGGYEYAKVLTAVGEAWVLCSNGMQAGPDTNAYFRVSTMDGESLFSVERTESVLIGVDATGIRCSGNTVTIPLDVVSAEAPVCYATDDLTGGTWSDLTSGTLPAWITAAEATGSAGAWTWTITTTSPCGFFQFRALQEGRTVIRNNASVELSQGIWVNGKKYMPVVSGSTLTWTEVQ